MSASMSENEMRCFKAAMKWQRKELLRELVLSLSPKLPFIDQVRQQSLWLKLTYSALVLALIPLLTLLWLLHALLQLLFFPYRYWAAFFKPRHLKGPGERNLQGVHNAFAKHLNLSAEHYIHCVNDWIVILYGEETLRQHRMENYVTTDNLTSRSRRNNASQVQVRSALTIARETLSQKLGCY